MFAKNLSSVFISIILSGIFSGIISYFLVKKNHYFKFIKRSDVIRKFEKDILRLGGLAIFISFILTFLIISKIINLDNQIAESVNVVFFLISPCLFFLIGLVDDFVALPPLPRLIGQILISIFSWFSGLRISLEQIPFFGSYISEMPLSELLSLLITIIWIVGITNAFNWIDGLDGLASGIAILSLVGFITMGLVSQNFNVIIIASIVLGCSSGFLYHNFYPAKIYMGDSGSYFIGSIISLLAISIINTSNFKSDLLPSLIILSIPILDMTSVIYKRLSQSKSPFYPDRSHLHHRFLDLGFSHKKSVLAIYSLDIFLMIIFLIIYISHN